MWSALKRTDLERARRELAARSSRALERHAAEIAALDGEIAELETLRRLVASFADKFAPAPPAAAPLPPPAAAPAPAIPIAPQHRFFPDPARAERRGQPLTNFEMLARAMGQR